MSMEQRIEQLETRVAFQDEALNRLSDIIADQRRELDRLQQEMAELKDRFREIRAAGVNPQEPEIPPHY
ncbi:MAG: SlyX family protein [Pseudomonadota bacterium]|nr:SlyX family protein [Pseudomonadota bacterium]